LRASDRGDNADGNLAALQSEMYSFVRSKGWLEQSSRRPQTPRNLATSISIESAELLEVFQWGDDFDPSRVSDELADIVLYALQLASVAGVDLATAVEAKLERNRSRTWDAEEALAG
jgi:NTP pyrophosphatase (non-canonical NTP hydrolase)